MSLLKRIRVLAAAIETTPGTAETLDATDAAMNVFDVDIQANIGFTERPQQGSFSMLQGVTNERGGTLSFRTDLYGDGAAGVPTWASVLFPACGWVESSQVFSPDSDFIGTNVKTATLGVYENGMLKVLAGAVGTFKFKFQAGLLVGIEWTFTGVWQPPTDATILAPTYPSIVPLRFSSATFTIGGSAPPCIQTLELDAGNNVILRPCPDTAAGYKTAVITNRAVKGTIDPEAQLVATDDVYGDWIGHNEQALSVALSDGTDTITVAAPKIQYTNIQEGDRDSLQTENIEFNCNASASAGDDELTITFA